LFFVFKGERDLLAKKQADKEKKQEREVVFSFLHREKTEEGMQTAMQPGMERQIRHARLKREQKERFIKAEYLNKAASAICQGNSGNYLNNGSLAGAQKVLDEVRTQMLPIGLKLEICPSQMEKELSELSHNTTISWSKSQQGGGGQQAQGPAQQQPGINMEQQSQLMAPVMMRSHPHHHPQALQKGPYGGMQGSIDRFRPVASAQQQQQQQGHHTTTRKQHGNSTSAALQPKPSIGKRGRKSTREKEGLLLAVGGMGGRSTSAKSNAATTTTTTTSNSKRSSVSTLSNHSSKLNNNTNFNNSSGSVETGGTTVSSLVGSPRLKASNFPASTLQIGNWKKVAAHEGELMAKCYYAKKKLVWEVMQNGVKSKIEMLWNDIVYLNYSTPKNRSAFLEIELSNPPVFAEETDPQPRRHTLWHKCEDFTSEGEASNCKPHRLFFAPGVLNKHIERLLKCDSRLRQLALQSQNNASTSSGRKGTKRKTS
jgi:hypothetical protein